MKKLLFIFAIHFILLPVNAGNLFADLQQQAPADTTIVKDSLEEEIIAEVIKTKAPPQKEKVQYFSQVTKYGFKNLFAQYNYNPALPYSVQVLSLIHI